MEPRIERIKTEVYFTDAAGIEWKVMDRWPRDFWGGLVDRYPGEARAAERIFTRWERVDGSHTPRLLETRRYQFNDGETRWFIAEKWAEQLARARRQEGR